MRYCDIFDPVVLGRMTLKEYTMRMKAVQLKRVDKELDIHLLAWKINEATATKTVGSGKNQKQIPYFADFKSFYDAEKREQEITGKTVEEKTKDTTLADLMARANS